ncbi:hypothetical protein BG004_005507 [Podila humilis]|nr:hypothetical protein BG004_005507 [Podila humilis]
MNQLTPLLFNYLEENARPHVQEKVDEEINETKVDLKRDLPDTILDYIRGVGEGAQDANAFIVSIAQHLGDDFADEVRSLTQATVDVASEGMDLLLTNGVMTVAKGAISKCTEEEGAEGSGGLNFEFLQSGKESMIATTMALSAPYIKQVSENISRKISDHIPTKVGGSVQAWIDEHGGSSGLLGKAAGFVAGFLNDDDDDEEEVKVVSRSMTSNKDIEERGGKTGKIQRAIQKYLGPKVLSMIAPYMKRFEEKMTSSLHGELTGKVFSIEYIKSKVISMVTGGAGPLGGILGALMGGGAMASLAGGSRGDDDEDDEEGGGGGGGAKAAIFGAIMGQVTGAGKQRGGDDDDEEDEDDEEGGSGGAAGGGVQAAILGAVMSKVAGAGQQRGGDDDDEEDEDDDEEGGSGGAGAGGAQAAILGALMSKLSAGGQGGGDDEDDEEGGSGGGGGGAQAAILGAIMSKVSGKGGDDGEEGNPMGALAGIASQFMQPREN